MASLGAMCSEISVVMIVYFVIIKVYNGSVKLVLGSRLMLDVF